MNLEAALRAALPDDVAVACMRVDAALPPLFPAEEAAMANARPERRQAFAAGRACARRAMAALAGAPVDGAAAAIPPASDRRRLWPEGIVGAIAHKGGWAAAVVGRAGRYIGLGIDLETPESLSSAVAAKVCLPAELAAAGAVAAPGGPGLDRTKLTFAAKEALFKAYYPAALHFLDFDEAMVTFMPGGTAGDTAGEARFTAHLVKAGTPDLGGRRHFEGRFGQAGGLLYAAMAVAVVERG